METSGGGVEGGFEVGGGGDHFLERGGFFEKHGAENSGVVGYPGGEVFGGRGEAKVERGAASHGDGDTGFAEGHSAVDEAVRRGGTLALTFELIGIGPARSRPEGARGVLGHRLLPLGDLHRVDVEFLGDFLDGFHALDRLKRHAGLEFWVVSSAFAFHFVCVRFGLQSAPTHHNHSLAPGPIFGDRLSSRGWLS